MANDAITFSCPACGIKLTVPGSLAGVTGPCPSCRNQIQAPYPASPVSVAPVQPYYPPAQEYPGHPPAQVPAVRLDPQPQYSPPYQPPSQSPAILKPEPRQLPTRTSTGDPVAKQIISPNQADETARGAKPAPRRSHKRERLIRVLIPLFFAGATAAIIFGVLTVLRNQNGKTTGKRSGETSQILIPEQQPQKKPLEPSAADPIDALPATSPAQPVIVEPPPDLPDGLEPVTPGQAASEVLEKFLSSKTLAERMPMIETHSSTEVLEKSCLNAPLPPTISVLNDGQETNAMERVVDIYFNVDFDAGNGQTNPHTLLVRIRGSGEPKVVVDPFLDLFGGRLAAYAKAPSEKAGVFQVIISAVASCNDERVPDREKKLTLKLLPRDNTKEIARAYFGRQSNIGMMLEDGTYSLSYGKAKACTVVLRWNTEDNPQAPYLEAIDLKTLDWNP